MNCPVCGDADSLRVTVRIQVCLSETMSFLDALKFRVAGPALREALVDEVRMKMTEIAMRHEREIR